MDHGEFSAHVCALYAGMCYPGREEDVLEHWQHGCYELRYKVGEVAYAVMDLEETIYKRLGEKSFPGMFTYEVTEVLGDFIYRVIKNSPVRGSFGYWPSEAARLTREFFEQGDAEDLPVVDQIIEGWLAIQSAKL